MKKAILFVACCLFVFSSQAFAFPKASNYDMGEIEENQTITGYVYMVKGEDSVYILENQIAKLNPGSVPDFLAIATYSSDQGNLGAIILKICPIGSKCQITGDIRNFGFETIRDVSKVQ